MLSSILLDQVTRLVRSKYPRSGDGEALLCFLCIRGFHWLLLKTITHDSLAGKQHDINYQEKAPFFLK